MKLSPSPSLYPSGAIKGTIVYPAFIWSFFTSGLKVIQAPFAPALCPYPLFFVYRL